MALKLVKTTKGYVSGVEMEGYTIYKGVPYAKPPVGELRFKPPVETEPWAGVLQAEHFSNRSMQFQQSGFYKKEFYDTQESMTPMDEDSLYLNIWTPANAEDEKLPVAFWIHGGAFINGFGHEKEFDGENYCKKGVILVTINYRLGAFGFLVHPWLIAENEKGLAGNYGIRDQIAALKWVYENIEAFGGNRENITVMGQSAGCMSVQTLISSELTKGMIAKAILQSGGGYECELSYDLSMEEAIKVGERFVELCGAESLQELRDLSKEKIQLATGKIHEYFEREGLGLRFIPVIDRDVLEAGHNELARKGAIQDIPYMIGSTKNDILCTPEQIEKGEHSSLYRSCVKWSLLLEELGRKPAYVYFFTRDLPGDDAGAFHSAELWYMFGTLDKSWRPKEAHDYKLSNDMIEAWTNFMKAGNPDSGQKEKWLPCRKDNLFVKEFH
ncbi:para-nitrobenzyl esterase [Anaerocolumna jejuensis DSM 15929]|uniref:Carboxylic ester hydrolase n=1 Tax=Anaerocolumna jejuensis DSM 15929 TaxID=1121322 RepID=A0A1M6QUI4_9FIRM|nr:carboxylesterase family protein [Anaerocolumna jejuensis]SHK23979.1 para-nitrobenzyl esterase [Anaerocolumna jejuensis DSM 15929]